MNPNTDKKKTLENSFLHVPISNASESRIAIMLLTSGQVSVAISSFVGMCIIKFQLGRNALIGVATVFLFTSALFLSGYVLQQQTVRDLRAAIKPKPTPENARMYLPKQFVVQPTPSPKAGIAGVSVETQVLNDSDNVVEVRESSNDIPADGARQMDPSVVDDSAEGRRGPRPAQDNSGGGQALHDHEPIELEDDPPQVPAYASLIPNKPKEKPLSRAERRKKIKDEILATGEGEGFKGYKRRQW